MANHAHGKKPAIAALMGNTLVTVVKAAVFFTTGSVSMFAEAIHSLADTLNQSLLLIGIKRSVRPADRIRGYGYGIERFFWSLISACGILFIGSGITLYHSINSLIERNSGEYVFSWLSILTLAVALVVEGITLRFAIKELKKQTSKRNLETDPVLLAIIYEDSVAVAGVVIALLAQWATYISGNVIYDALGGVAVGLALGFLAILLIIKNYHYIIGKPLDPEVVEQILQTLERDPCIERIMEFKSAAVDVNKYRIFATVEWNGSPLYEKIYEAGDLREEFENVKDDFGEFTKLILKTTDRIPRLIGNHIDIIEKNIIKKFPQISYVDIEIN